MSLNECIDYCSNILKSLKFQPDKHVKDLVNMTYDGKRLKWVNDFESLKKVIHDSFGLRGKWSSPGGGSKRFKSTNADVTITWYFKKQNTLLFQGRDGYLLRDKCVHICQTREQHDLKPPDKSNELANESFGALDSSFNLSARKTTKSEDVNETVATTTPTKGSPEFEAKSKADFINLIDDYSSSSSGCRCSCGVLAAELEGVKLDVVILQKRIDSQVNSATVGISSDNEEMNRQKREILEEREKSKRLEEDLLLIVKERDNEVKELKNTIISLETKVIKHEEENDSLRCALDLIIQDKTNSAKMNDVNVGNETEQCRINEQRWTTMKNRFPQNRLPQGKRRQCELKPPTKSSLSHNQVSGNRFSVLKDLNDNIHEDREDNEFNHRNQDDRVENRSNHRDHLKPVYSCPSDNQFGNKAESDKQPGQSIQPLQRLIQNQNRQKSIIGLSNNRGDNNLHNSNPRNESVFLKGKRKITIGEQFLNIHKVSKWPKGGTPFRCLKSLPL